MQPQTDSATSIDLSYLPKLEENDYESVKNKGKTDTGDLVIGLCDKKDATFENPWDAPHILDEANGN